MIRARIPQLKLIAEKAYMSLAKDLWSTYHRKLYVKWGYATFDDYLNGEVGVSKDYARRMRRIFSVFVLKCGVRPSELDKIGRTKAQMLLPVVNKFNARSWITAATELPCGDLQAKVFEARHSGTKSAPTSKATTIDPAEVDGTKGITIDAKPAGKSPIQLQSRTAPTKFVKRMFSLPEESDALLDEALGEAQRITKSSSEGFNLACIAQHFMAHRLTDEGKNDGRLYWFMRQMERIYGVRLLHIKSDKAWDLLRETVVDNQESFGTTGEFADDQERDSGAGESRSNGEEQDHSGAGPQGDQEGPQAA